MSEQKNLILAVGLAMVILFGFHFFYERPQSEQTQQQQTQSQATPPLAAAPVEVKPVLLDRQEALQSSNRLTINTPKLRGSIDLKGGQLDDLILTDYRETTNPNSPQIILLSPNATKDAYYVNFGWLSSDASLKLPDAESQWQTGSPTLSPNNPVTLRWDNQAGLEFERTISVDENFMFTVSDRVHNKGTSAITLRPQSSVVRVGTPPTSGYFILHEGPIGVLNQRLKEIDYKKLQGGQPTVTETTTGGWLGITDKYWMVALIPDQKLPVHTQFKGSTTGGQEIYQTSFTGQDLNLKPGEVITSTQHVFAGAKVLKLLDDYQRNLGVDRFDLAIDFGWFYFLTKPLFYALDFFHGLLGNFGLAILMLTVIVKLIFFPLANKSYRSMGKMKKFQPQIEKLKERFGHDKMRMNQELMELYKKEKINPISGCLPLLIQAPVFFCLYKVMFVTIEMRHAPFYGWIQDLSAPDPTSLFNLFGLLPITLPSFLMIGLWPILMGATMFLQQKMNPPPADPAQAKAFMIMPIFLTFLLAQFPAGLVIYWTWNNILSIAQQWMIMRLEEKRNTVTKGK